MTVRQAGILSGPASDVGKKGEQLAAEYLAGVGVEMESRNYRGTRGEIDLIGWDGSTLVFYEVKTRTVSREGFTPFDCITRMKVRRMLATAREFMYARLGHEVEAQLAVVTVVPLGLEAVRIEVIPLNA